MDNPRKRSYEHVKISDLQAAARNARTHSKRQIDQIANSIRRFVVRSCYQSTSC